jgi:hypothetical protein
LRTAPLRALSPTGLLTALSLASQGVFDTADGVLDLSRDLLALAFLFELSVARYLAGDFLDLQGDSVKS